jgi:hypothetical protein
VDKRLWLAYAASCLAARGIRVDASWAPDEIQGAWCAVPRPPVDVHAWVASMAALEASWSEGQAATDEAFVKQWNTKSDQLQPPAPDHVQKSAVELRALMPVRLKESPDTMAVFEVWADAKKETAYVMVSTEAGVSRKLVPTAELNRQGGG